MVSKPAISSTKKSTIASSKDKVSTKKSTNSVIAKIKSVHAKIQSMPLIAAVVAEFIGTFLLVSAIFAVQGQPLYVAFILIGIVLMIGGASGIYVNPAMTVGAWVTRKIKPIQAVCYILAQIFGAVIAWLVLNAFLNGAVESAALTGQSLFHTATLTSGKEWTIFFAELLGSTILALGIAAAIRAKRSGIKTALTYGFSILIALLVAGWVTSMLLTESNTALSFLNPAVAIAASGLSWNIWPIAIYIIAPVIGGILGFAIQDLLKTKNDECDCPNCNC